MKRRPLNPCPLKWVPKSLRAVTPIYQATKSKLQIINKLQEENQLIIDSKHHYRHLLALHVPKPQNLLELTYPQA